MPRHFNTAGPCEAHKHDMLPPADRLRDLRPLIDREAYFVIHAPRQTGKTTFIRWLADALGKGDYAAPVAGAWISASADLTAAVSSARLWRSRSGGSDAVIRCARVSSSCAATSRA